MCAPIEKGPSTDVLGTGTGGCSGCATSRGDRELPLTALLMWLLVVLSVARFRRRTRD
jgi:MYXO-CTERM domain-containing protein